MSFRYPYPGLGPAIRHFFVERDPDNKNRLQVVLRRPNVRDNAHSAGLLGPYKTLGDRREWRGGRMFKLPKKKEPHCEQCWYGRREGRRGQLPLRPVRHDLPVGFNFAQTPTRDAVEVVWWPGWPAQQVATIKLHGLVGLTGQHQQCHQSRINFLHHRQVPN